MAENAPSSEGGLEAPDRVGDLAVGLGFITPAQLEEAIQVQKAAAKAGFRRRLGDILVQKGFATPAQIQKALEGQKVEAGKNRIGNYELICKLGEGAMGAVYKARQWGVDREIALKILSPDLTRDEQFRERFIREARAVAHLNDPHIVTGMDVGSDKGVYYFAMEFVDGASVRQLMEAHGGRLPEKDALEYARQIALALHHAHASNLLHRDVKPENILVDRLGVAKLADLGLVRPNRPGADHADLAAGTPFYISPEQAQGKADLTPAADLYSLGATLYHALTGKPPYDGLIGHEILLKHANDPVPDPRKVNSQVSAAAARICMKLMQKDPKDRYPDGEALAEDLRRALEAKPAPKAKAHVAPQGKPHVAPKAHGTAAPAPRPPRGRPARRATARSKKKDLVIAVVLLVVLLGVIVYLARRLGARGSPTPVPTPSTVPAPGSPKAVAQPPEKPAGESPGAPKAEPGKAAPPKAEPDKQKPATEDKKDAPMPLP